MLWYHKITAVREKFLTAVYFFIDTTPKTNYTYEYDKVIFETDSSENYIWNVQGINLISRQINGEMFYCMYNAHADITRMADENGELAEKYYYDEWGVETETLRYGDITGDGEVNINDYSLMKRLILLSKSELTAEQKIVSDLNDDGKVDNDDVNILKQILFGDMEHCPADTNKDGFINEKNNIKYAGYFYDAETGLYYLNARFYDPETARFIQQDSYSGDILAPLSLNLYTYAQNNPISYYDPTGHSIKSLLKKAKDTVKKAASTIKAVATIAKPVVKQAVKSTASIAKTVTKTAINSGVRSAIQPVREAVKYVTNATENIRGQYETGLALMKTSMFSSGANAIANYYQGTYDTIMGQVEGFNQFYDNPVQTVSSSVNYFLSDPLKNNPVYGAGKWCSEFKSAVASNDWNTASYKLGVGVVNTAEVAGSIAIGGKIGGKIPTGKVSVPKVNAFSKIGNAIDNFGAPQLAGANGIVISGAVQVEASASSAAVAGASGVRAGVAAGSVAGSNIFYSGKDVGNVDLETSSSKQINKSSVNTDKLWDMPIGGKYINGRKYSQHALERMAPDAPEVRAELYNRANKLAISKGLNPQTKEYSILVNKYVDPRNIPPSVIEDAIKNTERVPGNNPDTFIHATSDVKVVVNENGGVITVVPK